MSPIAFDIDAESGLHLYHSSFEEILLTTLNRWHSGISCCLPVYRAPRVSCNMGLRLTRPTHAVYRVRFMGVFQINQSQKPWQNWQKVKSEAKGKSRTEANVFSSEIQKLLSQSFISQPDKQHLSLAKQAWCQRSPPGQDMIWHDMRWSLVFLWSLIPCCYWQTHTGIFIENFHAIPAIHMNSYSLTTQKISSWHQFSLKCHSANNWRSWIQTAQEHLPQICRVDSAICTHDYSDLTIVQVKLFEKRSDTRRVGVSAFIYIYIQRNVNKEKKIGYWYRCTNIKQYCASIDVHTTTYWYDLHEEDEE